MPYSDASGVPIWYEVAGDGPAMVLIHANPFDNTLWMYQSAHFSTWLKVISVDLRGYGRSEKQTTPFTLSDLCDDVIGVLDTEGVDHAILGGCSVGSGVAILLGLDHPGRFDAIFLVGGNSQASERYQKRIDGYTCDLETYHLDHMRQLVQPAFSGSRLGGYLLNRYVERQPRLNGDAIAQVFRAGNSTSTTDRLGEMKCPLLVINGEFDHSLPAGKRTASLVPGAVHKTLPGTGHACCLEDPAGFDALLAEFLEQHGLLPAI